MNWSKAIVICVAGLLLATQASAHTFTVNSAADNATSHDFTPGDGLCSDQVGLCTLRAAIEEANATDSLDYISFSNSLTGASIVLDAANGPLPSILQQVFIEALSMTAYNNTATLLRNAPPQITLDGSNLSDSSNAGLTFVGSDASGSSVQALSIVGFPGDAILASFGADSLSVDRNYLGVRPDGSGGGNGGNGFQASICDGHIVGKLRNVGGTAFLRLGNVIANNGKSGVRLGSSSGNVVNGNLIGISPTGTGNRGNAEYGIHITGNNNVVGDRIGDLTAGNFIAGNDLGGVVIIGESNFIRANTLGKGETGGFIVSEGHGIELFGSGNYIGDAGNNGKNGNKIYEHDGDGIRLGELEGDPADGNFIIYNQVGSPGSQFPLLLSGNNVGINVQNGDSNYINSNNVVNSSSIGIEVRGNANSLSANKVGFIDSINGPLAEPNLQGLIVVGDNNMMGAPGFPNYIGGNLQQGVRFGGAGNHFNYNFVGVNSSYQAIGNGGLGVETSVTDGVTLKNNVIGANAGYGLWMVTARIGEVADNLIGIAPDGSDIGNGSDGLLISLHSIDLDVHNNTIAFNDGNGIAAIGSDTGGVAWFQNSMHSNSGIGIDLGLDGVTPNDPGDADTGTNRLLNFPEIEQAVLNSAVHPPTLTVDYRVNSGEDHADFPFYIDFYWSDVDENAQGRYFLATDFAYTKTNDLKTFVINLPEGTTGGWLTATTLDQGGNSSELAARVLFGIDPGELIFADGLED